MLESNRQRIGEQLRVDLTDRSNAFRDYMAEFTKRVDYLSKNIADSLSQLPQAVGETADAFLDQVDRLGATLEEGQRRHQRRRGPPLSPAAPGAAVRGAGHAHEPVFPPRPRPGRAAKKTVSG